MFTNVHGHLRARGWGLARR